MGNKSLVPKSCLPPPPWMSHCVPATAASPLANPDSAATHYSPASCNGSSWSQSVFPPHVPLVFYSGMGTPGGRCSDWNTQLTVPIREGCHAAPQATSFAVWWVGFRDLTQPAGYTHLSEQMHALLHHHACKRNFAPACQFRCLSKFQISHPFFSCC